MNQKLNYTYLTKLSNVCRKYSLDHQQAFFEYCQFTGIKTFEDQTLIWNNSGGEILLTEAQIAHITNKLINEC
jgi:hypothetical protein